MTQVGRAADWTVAAAAVLSGQHPKKSKKNATQFSGRRSNYAHLGRANMPRVCKNNAKKNATRFQVAVQLCSSH